MESRPVIAVTSWTRFVRAARRERLAETVPRAYVEALEGAGALAFLLPNSDDPGLAGAYLDLADGLLLSGGDDPHPRLFGEEPHPRIETVDERRDGFEIALAREACARDLPVLGVCRGVQVLNLALGGDIYQDLASQTDSHLRHVQQTVVDGPWHEVSIAPGSRLGEIVGRLELRVNSFHHQACRRPGEGLVVSATAADGVIEAVEDPRRSLCLGVQWHPELSLDEPSSGSREIFAALVGAARRGGRGASKVRRPASPGR